MWLLLASSAASKCCWCDADTPKAAQSIQSSDGVEHELVFSDEFNAKGRDFANGRDAKWTALEVGDTSNKGTAFYLPGQATVQTDPNETDTTALLLLTENASHTGDSPTGEKGIHMPFRSAMLQSWNKFCFTGGIVEFRAKLPQGGGYWPALWTFGNLGRAVFQKSNTGLWPWSYDQCDADLVLPPTDPPQRISACDDQPPSSGLIPFQGRGATELDVLEGAVTNAGSGSYGVGSVQLSPGVPAYFKPPLFGFPTAKGAGSWYGGLKWGLEGKPNNGWYGPPFGSDCPTGCPDALSGGLTELDDLHTRYWTYRMEWKLGADGKVAWYYDGAFVWSMDAASFGEYQVCAAKPEGGEACERTPPREMPNEPMSLVINTAIGTWNGGMSALDGKHWPASFWIDYVRVWQPKGELNIGCNPPDYPTKAYIEAHQEWYGEPVTPSGYDTCPEVYPKSAYDHADALHARAKKIRATAAAARTTGADAAAAAAASGRAAAQTLSFAAASASHHSPRQQFAGAPRTAAASADAAAPSGVAIACAALAAIGLAAGATTLLLRRGARRSRGLEALRRDFEGVYHLAE